MFKLISLVGVFFLYGCKPSAVDTDGLGNETSEVRVQGESFEDAQKKYLDQLDALKLDSYVSNLSAASLAVSMEKQDFSDVTEYDSYDQILEAFATIRDERFLADPDDATFSRRITWLYPDDGCFVRTDLAIKKLTSKYPLPRKLFAFGELSVATSNEETGRVYWWFHVVPVVKVGDDTYVFDPAVDPSEPLAIEDWVSLVSPDTKNLKLSICDSGTFYPYSRCKYPVARGLSDVIQDMQPLLKKERIRLEELGRSSEKELGDDPPWK